MKYILALSLLLVSVFAQAAQVASYSVRIYNTHEAGCLGLNAHLVPHAANGAVCRIITLYASNGQRLAMLKFYPDITTDKTDDWVKNNYVSTISDPTWYGGYIHLHAYKMSEWSDIIDLLRNEAPLVVYEKEGFGGLLSIFGTGSYEPVGEGE